VGPIQTIERGQFRVAKSRDPRGKLGALLGFVEDMKAAAVKDEIEQAVGRRGGQKDCLPSSLYLRFADSGDASNSPLPQRSRDGEGDFAE